MQWNYKIVYEASIDRRSPFEICIHKIEKLCQFFRKVIFSIDVK